MMKFIAVALVAIVAVGQIMAQNSDEETSLLLGNEKLFADFCRNERSAITADIKSRVNVKSSMVYNLFFERFFIEITDEVLNVSREQVEKFTQQIREPSVSQEESSEAPLSEDQVQKMVNEGLENIKPQTGLIGRVRGASASVAMAMYNTAHSGIYARLAQLRTKMDKQHLLQGVVDACAQVSEYEQKLETDLAEVKTTLSEQYDQPEVRQFIESVTVPTLKCQTTKYVSRLQGFCTVLINGTGYLLKMLGLGSDFSFPQPSQ
jgi:transcriptional regulator NrdR family protein